MGSSNLRPILIYLLLVFLIKTDQMCNQEWEIRARDQYELFNSLESMDIAE